MLGRILNIFRNWLLWYQVQNNIMPCFKQQSIFQIYYLLVCVIKISFSHLKIREICTRLVDFARHANTRRMSPPSFVCIASCLVMAPLNDCQFSLQKNKPSFSPTTSSRYYHKIVHISLFLLGQGPLWTLKSQDFNGQNAILSIFNSVLAVVSYL